MIIREGDRHGEPMVVNQKEMKVIHHEIFNQNGQKKGTIRSLAGNQQGSEAGQKFATSRGEVVRYRAQKIGRPATYHPSYKQALKQFED
jgi:hypothetical protein